MLSESLHALLLPFTASNIFYTLSADNLPALHANGGQQLVLPAFTLCALLLSLGAGAYALDEKFGTGIIPSIAGFAGFKKSQFVIPKGATVVGAVAMMASILGIATVVANIPAFIRSFFGIQRDLRRNSTE